ncbi:MAG: LLM class flavin-dependent oxidoreductase [Chloroflexi bacterium]|nr:LLM class flavin-dependent oxidoreductase [Chloroflexota bacterium]
MADRIGLYLQDDLALPDAIRAVQYAEARGFESVWQAESRLVRDAVVPMAAFAAATNRIKIGSGVLNIWTRNAAAIAATLLTLDDLAPDRIICGLGGWWEPLAQQVGINRRKPLLAMREVVAAVRALLTLERVNFSGEFVYLDDVVLDVVHGRQTPRHIPIYIGATGPQMMALAGEIADGVLLNYLVSPEYNAAAVDLLERGARQAGRRIDDIDRPQLIVCAVNKDRAQALDAARALVTQTLYQQPQLMKASGVPQDLISEVSQVLAWPATDDQLEQAMRLVPDDVVQLLTAAGLPAEVRAQIRAYVAAGASYPVVYPLGTDAHLLIDALADGYSG